MNNADSSQTPPTAIVYASVHHGNTRRIAEVLASELSADLFSVDESTSNLSEYDLIGVGSGIYFGRHHRTIRQVVATWHPPPPRVFLFSTAGLPFLSYFQHASLRRRVRKLGCEIVGEFCCRGWDTVGPLWLVGGINRKRPNERDLERARQFAAAIRRSISKLPEPAPEPLQESKQ